MEKLNVRFDDKTKEKISEIATRDSQPFSVVAREAMAIGLYNIKHSPAYTQKVK